MKKLISLLKAMFSQDMNIFKFDSKNSNSKFKKVVFPALIALIIMLSIGVYSVMLAEPLSKLNLTYIMLTIFMAFVSVITFMEGIYKSQGILFEGRDNDLLLSLPIKKSSIFGLRILKLLSFQFLFNMLFMIPAYAVYIFFEQPGISFYLLSIMMLILLPIIPTVISCILGYIVKSISSRFKAKKAMQTILSIILALGVFYFSFSLEDMMGNLVQNATSINDMLMKIYYPIGAYITLIQDFNIVTFLINVLINVAPLIIVIYLGSIFYFKIISKSSEVSTSKRTGKACNLKIKVSSKIWALMKKEFKRFFSSPVYILNSLIGIILLVVATVGLSIDPEATIMGVVEGEKLPFTLEQVYKYLPIAYIVVLLFTGLLTPITAPSISIEGKNFNIIKAVPIKAEELLKAKLLMSNLITMPITIICSIVFSIAFRIETVYAILILAYAIVIPVFAATMGLLINLKWPKMNANNDTEVVKQSASVLLSICFGMLISFGSAILIVYTISVAKLVIALELITLGMLTIAMWLILKHYGERRIREINI